MRKKDSDWDNQERVRGQEGDLEMWTIIRSTSNFVDLCSAGLLCVCVCERERERERERNSERSK